MILPLSAKSGCLTKSSKSWNVLGVVCTTRTNVQTMGSNKIYSQLIREVSQIFFLSLGMSASRHYMNNTTRARSHHLVGSASGGLKNFCLGTIQNCYLDLTYLCFLQTCDGNLEFPGLSDGLVQDLDFGSTDLYFGLPVHPVVCPQTRPWFQDRPQRNGRRLQSEELTKGPSRTGAMPKQNSYGTDV